MEFKKTLYDHADSVWTKEKDTAWTLGIRSFTIDFSFDKRVFITSIQYAGNKIIYLDIAEYRDDSGPGFHRFLSRNVSDTGIRYIDSNETNKILSVYNRQSNADLSWKSLYDDNTSVFSTGCGYAAFPPETFFEMIFYAKTNDRKNILHKCRSLYPHVQAYGALGLFFLKKDGKKLTDEEEALLSKISRSEELITVCEGCIFGEQKKLSEVLSPGYLKSFYSSYADYSRSYKSYDPALDTMHKSHQPVSVVFRTDH